MRRRPAELHTGDWVDVVCAMCHRRIYDEEWRDESEYGTMCRECYDRVDRLDDGSQGFRLRRRRHGTPLDV